MLVLRRGGELWWVVGCSLEGKSWDGEEEGEIEEESVGRVGIYWLLPMKSLIDTFRWYTRRWFRRWLCHITVWRSRFESLGHSVGKIIKNKSTSSHRCNSPKKLYNPLAIWSVYTNRIRPSVYIDRIANGYCLSVYTDRSRDGIISVGKNYRWKNSVGFCRFSGSESTIQWVFMNMTFPTWFSFMYNNLKLFFFFLKPLTCFLVTWKTRGEGRELKSIGKLRNDDKHFKAGLLTYSSSSPNN